MQDKRQEEYNDYFSSLTKGLRPKSTQFIVSDGLIQQKITDKVSDKLFQEITVAKIQLPRKLAHKELKYPPPVVL